MRLAAATDESREDGRGSDDDGDEVGRERADRGDVDEEELSRKLERARDGASVATAVAAVDGNTGSPASSRA